MNELYFESFFDAINSGSNAVACICFHKNNM